MTLCILFVTNLSEHYSKENNTYLSTLLGTRTFDINVACVISIYLLSQNGFFYSVYYCNAGILK